MPDDALSLPCPSLCAAAVAPSLRASLTLCDVPLGATVEIHAIAFDGDPEERALALRLLEIGFVPGERVRVIAHGHPGREPVAVRIGGTTFALRRFEAERVLVARTARAASAT